MAKVSDNKFNESNYKSENDEVAQTRVRPKGLFKITVRRKLDSQSVAVQHSTVIHQQFNIHTDSTGIKVKRLKCYPNSNPVTQNVALAAHIAASSVS